MTVRGRHGEEKVCWAVTKVVAPGDCSFAASVERHPPICSDRCRAWGKRARDSDLALRSRFGGLS